MNEKTNEKLADRLAPPYVSFNTFLTSIDRLKPGIPNRIDKSVWESFAGSVQGQLLIAYRFLGLIDEKGDPQPVLSKIVHSEGEDRVLALADILRSKYPKLFALNLQNATSAQVQESLGSMGAQGETLKKAFSFFMKATKIAKIPISHNLQKAKLPKTTSTKRKSRQSANPPPTQEQPATPGTQAGESRATVITLSSGGELKLILEDANVFTMDEATFSLVKDLKTRIQEYEINRPSLAKTAETDANENETDDEE